MEHKVKFAHEKCGNKGFITREALREAIPTPAWEPLEKKDSVLSKVLLSDAFKTAKMESGSEEIDVKHFLAFSLLHCVGSSYDKARALFCILQDGGFKQHDMITANDKDLYPLFDKMCYFVTKDIIRLASLHGEMTTPLYTETEIDKLVDRYIIEGVRED